jgi:orotidine-5'-phosphate decarboxylase
MKGRVCIALDVDDLTTASALVAKLAAHKPIFKVGSHLFAGGQGKKIIDEIHRVGAKVFLDLKFHDIPNTVANAAKIATQMGVYMFNVHSLGGLDMMKAVADMVAEEAVKNNLPKPIVLAITVLTSMSEEDLKRDLLVNEALNSYIVHLASLTKKAGLSGVVCSPKEIRLIKDACGSAFVVVTPGIRPEWSVKKHDQKRVLTAKQAFEMGADYIVVGRPVIQATDPLEAFDKLVAEINGR